LNLSNGSRLSIDGNGERCSSRQGFEAQRTRSRKEVEDRGPDERAT